MVTAPAPAMARAGKVGVVGAGGAVGAAAAFAIASSVGVEELALADVDARSVTVQAMDLEPLTALGHVDRIRVAGLRELADADVVVVTAGAAHVDGWSRSEYASANAPIVGSIVSELTRAPEWSGRLLIATNPVDVVCTLAADDGGTATAGSILGYSLNDSLRLRQALARHVGVPAGRIEAWTIGEHGDHGVPLFSRATADQRPLDVQPSVRAAVRAELDTWYERWQRLLPGRTAALVSGAGIARMVGALVGAWTETLVACVPVDGRYGIDGVCLGMPVRLSAASVEILDWPLAPDELEALTGAAAAVERHVRAATTSNAPKGSLP